MTDSFRVGDRVRLRSHATRMSQHAGIGDRVGTVVQVLGTRRVDVSVMWEGRLTGTVHSPSHLRVVRSEGVPAADRTRPATHEAEVGTRDPDGTLVRRDVEPLAGLTRDAETDLIARLATDARVRQDGTALRLLARHAAGEHVGRRPIHCPACPSYVSS